jgi:hypothetical protein
MKKLFTILLICVALISQAQNRTRGYFISDDSMRLVLPTIPPELDTTFCTQVLYTQAGASYTSVKKKNVKWILMRKKPDGKYYTYDDKGEELDVFMYRPTNTDSGQPKWIFYLSFY